MELFRSGLVGGCFVAVKAHVESSSGWRVEDGWGGVGVCGGARGLKGTMEVLFP